MALDTASAADLDFPLKSSLDRHPFPRLVREIARRRASGSLYLLSGKTKKVVFFEEGQPVFVRSNVLSECLGQTLVEKGLITQEQCDRTLEAIRRTGKKQGELLVEMGVLSEGNLRYGLESQLRSKLFDIFSWTSGRYQFRPGAPKEGFRIRLSQSAEAVIVEALLDRIDAPRARAALDPYEGRFPVAQTDGDELGLLPEERHFLRCLDGSRTVAEVLADPPEPKVPFPAVLMHALLQAAVVRVASKRQPAKEPPPPPALVPEDLDDDALAAGYEPRSTITEYEDTPLPGEMPSAADLMGDDDFDVQDMEQSSVTSRGEIEELLAAEPEAEDEVFDDEIELLEEDAVEIVDDEVLDEAAMAVDDDLALEPTELDLGEAELAPEAELEDLDDLADLDVPDDLAVDGEDLALDADLDEVDLGDAADLDEVDLAGAEEAAYDEEDPEMLGAMRFSEGQQALVAGDYAGGVALLEDAYAHGVDVAELHAMLAYGRFMTSPEDPDMASHALELLEYAESMNPDLDLVHAYRGAIFRAIGDPANARLSLERALEINPYCDLALQIMDTLG